MLFTTGADAEPAPNHDSHSRKFSFAIAPKSPNGSTQTAGIGAFETFGDNVHISSSAPTAVSGHGWWQMVSGPAGVKAKVTVFLQAQDTHGKWTTVNTGYKIVYSGGGSANRASAQKQCTNLVQRVVWRTLIDVDLIGYNDTPGVTTTSAITFYCGAGL